MGSLTTFKKSLGVLKRSPTARNGAWIIAERIFSIGITSVITIIAARYLGAEDYGVVSYGLSMVAIFTAITKLGIDSIIVNELIQHRGRQGDIMGTSIALRFAASLLSIIAMAALLLLINGDNPFVVLIALVQAVQLMFLAINVLDYWFQSRLESRYVSIAKILATILASSYGLYVLMTGMGAVFFAASTVVTAAVVTAVLVFFYIKQGGERLRFSRPEAKRLLSISHHFIVANIISLIYIQIGKIMIGNIQDSYQLGVYAAAMLLCTAWMFLPEAITISMRPTIISAKRNSELSYIRKLKSLYFIIFWISVVISLAIALTAPILVPLLFGDEYASGVLVVQIAVWFAPLSALGVARNIWLVSENKHKYAKYILIYGVVINAILSFMLISAIGIVGAAIAVVVTEFITCFLTPLIYKQTRSHTRLLMSALLSFKV